MGHRGFGLKLLFLVVTLISFLMWAVASPSLVSCITGIVVWSFAGAVLGLFRYGRPLSYGAASGATAVVAFIACFWPIFLGGYFFHQGPEDYFEDGFEVEAFIYPVVYCLVYAPVAAAIGIVVGSIVSFADSRLTSRCS